MKKGEDADGVGVCEASKSVLGNGRTEERAEKKQVKGWDWWGWQGVNVSEHVL